MSTAISFKTEHAPAYAALILQLPANQTVLVEAGAMASMDSHIQMKSKMKGGVLKSVGRMFGGESMFISEFTAIGKAGELILAPGVPGDVTHYSIQSNKGLIIQSSGFVACAPTVNLDTKFQGLKGFFSGESLFMVKASGEGDIWFSSYGGIIEIPVDGNYIVDQQFQIQNFR
jgi:uncharacterized protein (TIGR00266 family)